MTAEIVESRLRRLLLIIVILIFIGTLIELSLQEHFEGLIQKIPAYLSLRGALGVLWVYLHPNRWSIYTLRVIMLVLGLGGIYGIYQHFTNNLAFELQIPPRDHPRSFVGRRLRR